LIVKKACIWFICRENGRAALYNSLCARQKIWCSEDYGTKMIPKHHNIQIYLILVLTLRQVKVLTLVLTLRQVKD